MDQATIVFLGIGAVLGGYGLYLKLELRRLRERLAKMQGESGRPPV